VSYYDYYQPEAYIPQTDTFIEKDSDIDDNVERLRHAATAALLTRRDCVVVATVSCIYGLGTPEEYAKQMLFLQQGQEIDRQKLLRRFVDMQYKRNDLAFTRGTFRVKGDTVEIIPVYEENAIRLEFFGDEIDRISTLNPITGDEIGEEEQIQIFPATQYANGPERTKHAIQTIQEELDEQLAKFKKEGKLLEAQRLQQRTSYDLEMLSQVGTCSGVENYSRHFDQRAAGTPPHTLLDFFPDDFLLIIDESHVTVPQIGGMYHGDMSRKRTLVQYGFRLPSAMDNRPLKWDEFESHIGQTIYLSATPGDYERDRSDGVVDQVIRPTGLLDPLIDVRPTKGQIDDLLDEINQTVARGERALVTTLTKKMAEDLSDYLLDHGVKVKYLHSDIDTLKRVELLRELREGKIDVIVGINLLREGLDLPEVSLVAILDADKEGFLRSYRSLIQTIGRAARNVHGHVVMYADTVTDSMRQAIDETKRRRSVQEAYNKKHHRTPQPLVKKITDVNDMIAKEDVDTQSLLAGGYRNSTSAASSHYGIPAQDEQEITRRHEELEKAGMPAEELNSLIRELDAKMRQASEQLQFELAARLRDEIMDLKKELRAMIRAQK
ncbi:MAG: excinuclease ABC subunit UvrB, partial [Aeriscardovia aeriphila]|nr:excinuclease ABC subunit UvrB [Aeriscardovia aeriphila]